MKILITGGSGFIGTNLIDFYKNKNVNILNLDIKTPRNLKHLTFWKNIDICDADKLNQEILNFSPNIIFHLAAKTDLDGLSLSDYEVNTTGVKSIITASLNLPNLQRIIFASSMLVCKLGYQPINDSDYCPDTIYGESKVIGEQIVKSLAGNKLPWSIVRPTSIWGPWFSIPYRNFFDNILKGYYIHPYKKRIIRSYGFILNSVYQLHCLSTFKGDLSLNGKIFYLADYEPIELYDWACIISMKSGLSNPIEVPLIFLRALALVGDLLKSLGITNPPLTSFRLKNLLTSSVFNMDLLRLIVGPIPYDTESGVKKTLDWMNDTTSYLSNKLK